MKYREVRGTPSLLLNVRVDEWEWWDYHHIPSILLGIERNKYICVCVLHIDVYVRMFGRYVGPWTVSAVVDLTQECWAKETQKEGSLNSSVVLKHGGFEPRGYNEDREEKVIEDLGDLSVPECLTPMRNKSKRGRGEEFSGRRLDYSVALESELEEGMK